jgi:hypothetical protein
MAPQKSLSRKHVETLLNSESEDDFYICGDRSDNSNSDVIDSRDESNNDTRDSECDISTPPAQKKTKIK